MLCLLLISRQFSFCGWSIVDVVCVGEGCLVCFVFGILKCFDYCKRSRYSVLLFQVFELSGFIWLLFDYLMIVRYFVICSSYVMEVLSWAVICCCVVAYFVIMFYLCCCFVSVWCCNLFSCVYLVCWYCVIILFRWRYLCVI